MNSKCPHFNQSETPTCFGPITSKFQSFSQFVDREPGVNSQVPFPIYRHCLVRTPTGMETSGLCIGCLHCVFGCPGHSGNIAVEVVSENDGIRGISIRVASGCGKRQEGRVVKSIWGKIRPFEGDLIVLERLEEVFPGLDFDNFDTFFSRDETKRIAVWVSTLTQALFGSTAVVSREIPIQIKNKPRDGRIDVGVRFEDRGYAIETKTTFDDAMDDDRFDAQLINYQREIDRLKIEKELKNFYQVLVIAGDESALLPSSHRLCTSLVGDRAQTFYERLQKTGVTLVSAQALLMLGIRSLFDEKVVEKFEGIVRQANKVAILTAGVVQFERGGFYLSPAKALQ